MKKITLLAVAFVAVTFASCAKTHTCVCQVAGTTTQTISLPKQTSSAAKTSCSSYDALYGTCTIQ
jgi:hypothetical protein